MQYYKLKMIRICFVRNRGDIRYSTKKIKNITVDGILYNNGYVFVHEYMCYSFSLESTTHHNLVNINCYTGLVRHNKIMALNKNKKILLINHNTNYPNVYNIRSPANLYGINAMCVSKLSAKIVIHFSEDIYAWNVLLSYII